MSGRRRVAIRESLIIECNIASQQLSILSGNPISAQEVAEAAINAGLELLLRGAEKMAADRARFSAAGVANGVH